jgi:alpha-tubulin suppressor-like RCC1 family protein
MACGVAHCLALTKTDGLYTWGYNTYGNCGLGVDTEEILVPTKVKLDNIVDISAG